MNNKSKLMVLMVAAVLSFGSVDQVPETHIITLIVDTKAIDEANVNEMCNFGQEIGISNTEYTIIVKPGDIVMWQGVSSNSPETDHVMIESINHETGAKVFGRNTLRDDSQNPGVVVGIVSEGNSGDVEKYKVSFKVLNSGTARGSYEIDPKIQVR